MTEDDGYETIVPDLNVMPSDELLLAKMDYMIGFPRVFQEDDFKRVVAEHRQAAYNQALKDAAEVAKREGARNIFEDHRGFCRATAKDIECAILSLGKNQ